MQKKRHLAIIFALIIAIVGMIGGIYIWTKTDSTDKIAIAGQESQVLHKKTGYAKVNGVNMYYETYGEKNDKPPLLLLHGSHTDIQLSFSKVIPELAKSRQVIGLEIQGHGHTADVDGRPLTYQQVADDVAGFLRQQKIAKVDIFGWSMGGNIATEVTLRHPELVHKTAVIGANYKGFNELFEPAVYEAYEAEINSGFAPKQFTEPYEKNSPNPEKWDQLVAKLWDMDDKNTWPTDEQIKGIKTPFLIMLGDRDPIPTAHAVEWYKLLPQGQLDIMPNADHFVTHLQPQLVLGSLLPFLDGPETVSNENINTPEALDKQ